MNLLESVIAEIAKKLNENANENISLISYYEDYNEDFEDLEMDYYDVGEDAYDVAKKAGINILSSMELSAVLVDTEETLVIGGVWVSNDSKDFSFDIAIDPSYQKRGLSKSLIDHALGEFESQKDAHRKLKMRVDVVNKELAINLQKYYNFKVVQKIDNDRVIMTV
jgi:ribosomal protein S18 acetylase RimI-like enzyme